MKRPRFCSVVDKLAVLRDVPLEAGRLGSSRLVISHLQDSLRSIPSRSGKSSQSRETKKTLALHRDTDLHRQLLASGLWRQSGDRGFKRLRWRLGPAFDRDFESEAPSWSGMVLTEKTCLRERQMCARGGGGGLLPPTRPRTRTMMQWTSVFRSTPAGFKVGCLLTGTEIFTPKEEISYLDTTPHFPFPTEQPFFPCDIDMQHPCN